MYNQICVCVVVTRWIIGNIMFDYIFPGKFCTERMSPEEIEAQKVPLTERMVREPFWLGLITVLVVMIVIGVGYLVKKHLPEKIEKLLRTEMEANPLGGGGGGGYDGNTFTGDYVTSIMLELGNVASLIN